MDTNTPPLEDFERWFYGGAPPAGDDATEAEARADVTALAFSDTRPDCRCKQKTQALLLRLRERAPAMVLAA